MGSKTQKSTDKCGVISVEDWIKAIADRTDIIYIQNE